jgi:hypothetical protein
VSHQRADEVDLGVVALLVQLALPFGAQQAAGQEQRVQAVARPGRHGSS